MKLNPNQALIHYPNILLSHKFRFHPRNQSLFSKENHIHEKHPFFFRKSYPNSSSPLFLPSPFIPFSSSISFSVQFHLDFPLSSLFFFTLFQLHTHTHTYICIYSNSTSLYWTCRRTFPARVTYNRVIPVGFLQARAAMPEESVVEPKRKLGRAYWRQFFEMML